jgi:hypothetical protein
VTDREADDRGTPERPRESLLDVLEEIRALRVPMNRRAFLAELAAERDEDTDEPK